jgi:hypothetical protein
MGCERALYSLALGLGQPWETIYNKKYQIAERALYRFVVDLGKSSYQSWKIWRNRQILFCKFIKKSKGTITRGPERKPLSSQ